MPGGIIATVQREGDARTRGSKIADAHPDLWDRSAGRRFGVRRDPGAATEARDAPPDKSNVSSQTATLIDVDGEMMRLRVIVDSAESERAWMARTQAPVAASAQTIDRPQLLVVVDPIRMSSKYASCWRDRTGHGAALAGRRYPPDRPAGATTT